MVIKRYSLDELQPGMVLGQPVNDDSGRTIIQEGARLTPMHIKRLEKWGVTVVGIELEEEESGGTESEGQATIQEASAEERESMRRVAAEVQERFSDTKGNPVMEELKRLVVRHLVLTGKDAIPKA